MDKGSALNQRVWRLFERAGFATTPSSTQSDEEKVTLPGGRSRKMDLVARDETLGVKIIGSNKARRKLNEAESFTALVHDLVELRKAARADSVLFVSTDYDPTESDREYALHKNLRVWSVEELEYFEALVDAIGEYAKYEIIHYFGIATKEEKHIFNVIALRIHQPFGTSDTELYLFSVPPSILLKTSVVLRKAQGSKDAYQRILQKKRLHKISKFVATANALLPPNIIVHLSDGVTVREIQLPQRDLQGKRLTLTRRDTDLVLLSIPLEYASLELIDGQHRLFGFTQTEAATREHFNLVVLGVTGLSSDRRTGTFVAINDNARRMDPNLVYYLKYTSDESACQADNELMAIKVVIELNNISPFRKKIRVLDVGNQRITLKGFAGYDLKGLFGERGRLRKYYPHESKAYVGALRLYFGILKSLFPNQWRDPDQFIMFTNRGISAFLKLLKSILKNHAARLDETSGKKYLQPIRDNWADKHWRTKDLRNAYVGSQGWKMFHAELVAAIREKYSDFKG